MSNNNFFQKEKTMLVGVIHGELNRDKVDQHLDELLLLTETAGGEVIDTVVQKINRINPSFFIGTGKANEIINRAKQQNISMIIFDDELSPSHVKNFNKLSEEIKIIDRSALILEIFKQHAQTKEAKTQVELAQLQYMLPRLTRAWTHLERQMGGIGTRAGAGETQIEVDRRLVRTRISKLKKELIKIDNERSNQRKRRDNKFKVALVGYTNAGKSTLMNVLSGANVYTEDQLFATLDTTIRSVKLDRTHQILLSDTVGFIRKLPHHLIASFKSTLNEVIFADLILLVLDASSNQILDEYETIKNVLKELGVARHPKLIVMNKIDQVSKKNKINNLKNKFPKSIFISALNQLRIDQLSSKIIEVMDENLEELNLTFSYNEPKEIAIAQEGVSVLERNYNNDHVELRVKGTRERIGQLLTILDKKKTSN